LSDHNGISEAQLEKESKTLDIKFNDLLKVFTEPTFLSTSKNLSKILLRKFFIITYYLFILILDEKKN